MLSQSCIILRQSSSVFIYLQAKQWDDQNFWKKKEKNMCLVIKIAGYIISVKPRKNKQTTRPQQTNKQTNKPWLIFEQNSCYDYLNSCTYVSIKRNKNMTKKKSLWNINYIAARRMLLHKKKALLIKSLKFYLF